MQSPTLRWLHIENLYNLLNSMLSRAVGAMFKVKQQFTENYLLLLHITLFSVHFNSFEVIHFQSLNVWNSYRNNQLTSIKKLIRVPYNFSLYYKVT